MNNNIYCVPFLLVFMIIGMFIPVFDQAFNLIGIMIYHGFFPYILIYCLMMMILSGEKKWLKEGEPRSSELAKLSTLSSWCFLVAMLIGLGIHLYKIS